MNLLLRKSTFYFLVTGTVIMMVLMFITGKDLNTAATPLGIIDLELARSDAAVQHILNAWSKEVSEEEGLIDTARINTFLDFIFLIFYSLLLYVCCKQLAALFPSRKSLRTLLNLGATLALLSGLLDVVENMGMLMSLYQFSGSYTAAITAGAAYLKWLMVASTLLVIIFALLFKSIEKWRGDKGLN